MSKKNKLAGAFSEVSDLLDEIKATLEAQGYDFDECSVDENECEENFGDDVFRLYELHKEMKNIVENQ